MEYTSILGTASTIMTAVAYLSYFRSISKVEHGLRPSRMTWLLLATISWIVAVNSYLADATDTLGPLLMNAAGSTIVFLLSLKQGIGGWSEIDRLALFGAVVVFLTSLYVGSPLFSLVLALSFDLFALLPTRLIPLSPEFRHVVGRACH